MEHLNCQFAKPNSKTEQIQFLSRALQQRTYAQYLTFFL